MSSNSLPVFQNLEATLERMRESGEIDDIGVGVLERHFEERAETLAADLQELLQEYERRAGEGDKDAALRWLSEASEALGKRDREHTERVLSTVVATPGN